MLQACQRLSFANAGVNAIERMFARPMDFRRLQPASAACPELPLGVLLTVEAGQLDTFCHWAMGRQGWRPLAGGMLSVRNPRRAVT